MNSAGGLSASHHQLVKSNLHLSECWLLIAHNHPFLVEFPLAKQKPPHQGCYISLHADAAYSQLITYWLGITKVGSLFP